MVGAALLDYTEQYRFHIMNNLVQLMHVGLSVCRYSLRSPFFTSSNTIIGYQEDLI